MDVHADKSALVVNPWVTDFKLYDEWMHPVGLYALMSVLRFNGWRIDFINCLRRGANQRTKKFSTGEFPWVELPRPRAFDTIPRRYKKYGIDDHEFRERLSRARRPDIILVGSGMTYWIDGLADTIKSIRCVWPDSPLVIGGLSAKLIPAHLRTRFPHATVFTGDIWRRPPGAPVTIAPGLDLATEGWSGSVTAALELLESPYHGPILSSVGCPFRCSYCASRILQPAFRQRNPAIIAEETAFLAKKFSIIDFSFFDDALLYRPGGHLFRLLDLFSDAGLKPRLHCPNGLHIRWIDKCVAQRMIEGGFITFRFGFESGRREYRADTDAKASRTLVAEKLGILQDARGKSACDIGVYVMAGLPGQTPAQVIEDMRFIGSLGVNVKPVFLSPVPGTKLFARYCAAMPAIQENPLLHNDAWFITALPGWRWERVEEIRNIARELNATVREKSPHVHRIK